MKKMTAHHELTKLRWQCRRGVKELDIMLSNYLEQHYTKADRNEKQRFKNLLCLEDPILILLLLDNVKEDDNLQDIVQQKLRTKSK